MIMMVLMMAMLPTTALSKTSVVSVLIFDDIFSLTAPSLSYSAIILDEITREI